MDLNQILREKDEDEVWINQKKTKITLKASESSNQGGGSIDRLFVRYKVEDQFFVTSSLIQMIG